jgi:drug/metabolite transporter (DMT)-like permease
MVSDTGFIGALFALGSATTGALAMIQVRRLTHSEGTGAIVFYFSAFSALLALLTLFFGWVMPTTEQTLYLILAGLLGGVGQVLMTHSYRFAEASIIAPFDYTAMLWVILLGIFVFGEIPGPNVIIGSVIIVGSGVFVLIREHRNGLLRSKARRANTPT